MTYKLSYKVPQLNIFFYFRQILTILESTLSEGDNALCQALDKFINNCTTILGWCFTEEHVQDTMKEQRQVSRLVYISEQYI